MYGPPGEVMKLGTPATVFCDETPELNWYSTPVPLNASMWGLRAFRFGWFTTCWGVVVVVVTGETGAGTGAPVVVVARAAVVDVVDGDVVDDEEILVVDVVLGGPVVVVEGFGTTVVVVVVVVAPAAARLGRVRLQTASAAAMPVPRHVKLIGTAPLSRLRSFVAESDHCSQPDAPGPGECPRGAGGDTRAGWRVP
jgi:hypothetical protein